MRSAPHKFRSAGFQPASSPASQALSASATNRRVGALAFQRPLPRLAVRHPRPRCVRRPPRSPKRGLSAGVVAHLKRRCAAHRRHRAGVLLAASPCRPQRRRGSVETTPERYITIAGVQPQISHFHKISKDPRIAVNLKPISGVLLQSGNPLRRRHRQA